MNKANITIHVKKNWKKTAKNDTSLVEPLYKKIEKKFNCVYITIAINQNDENNGNYGKWAEGKMI